MQVRDEDVPGLAFGSIARIRAAASMVKLIPTPMRQRKGGEEMSPHSGGVEWIMAKQEWAASKDRRGKLTVRDRGDLL